MNQIKYKYLFLSLLMSLLFVLVACGATKDAANEKEKVDTVNQDETADENTAFPRTVTDQADKEVVLEAQPDKVVVTHFGHLDFLFALGVKAVAGASLEVVDDWDSFEPYREEIASIEDIGTAMAIDMEKLVELDPDLIIHFVESDEQIINQYNQIAPIAQTEPYGDWQERTEIYAELTGKEEEGKKLIEELETEIKLTRESLNYNPKETVFSVIGKDLWAGSHTSAVHIYDPEKGVGLNAPENVETQDGKISLEGLIDLNPDHLLIMTNNEEEYKEVLDMLNASDAWLTTTAAQNDQVYYLNRSAQGGAPLSVKYTLERMKEIFGEK